MGGKAESEKVRILLVVRWPVGGIRTFLRYVYKQFDSSRYHFVIVLPEHAEHETLTEDLRPLNPSLFTLPRNYRGIDFFGLLLRTIRSQKIDLIHSHGLTAGIYSGAAAILTGKPHVLTIHDVFTERQLIGIRGYLIKKALPVVMRMPDIIHCVSNDSRNNIVEYVPAISHSRVKIVVIENGIETERFRNAEKLNLRMQFNLPDDAFLIGFFGRFMSPKGFRHLVEALEILLKEHPARKRPLVLTFGIGGYRREEMDYVKKKGLEKDVLFLPFMPNIASALKGLDLVAMPSLWEASGLLAMEAMVAGVPVIGTDCIGLREVLRDTPASIVPAGNSRALADAIASAMEVSQNSKLQEFAEIAAMRFDVRKQAEQLESLMAGLLKERGVNKCGKNATHGKVWRENQDKCM